MTNHDKSHVQSGSKYRGTVSLPRIDTQFEWPDQSPIGQLILHKRQYPQRNTLPIERSLLNQIGVVDDHADAVDILLDASAVKPLS